MSKSNHWGTKDWGERGLRTLPNKNTKCSCIQHCRPTDLDPVTQTDSIPMLILSSIH